MAVVPVVHFVVHYRQSVAECVDIGPCCSPSNRESSVAIHGEVAQFSAASGAPRATRPGSRAPIGHSAR